jgi:hypothetical protein
MEDRPSARTREDRPFKGRATSLRREKVLPIVASIDGVVDRPRGLDPRPAWHPLRSSPFAGYGSIFILCV